MTKRRKLSDGIRIGRRYWVKEPNGWRQVKIIRRGWNSFGAAYYAANIYHTVYYPQELFTDEQAAKAKLAEQ